MARFSRRQAEQGRQYVEDRRRSGGRRSGGRTGGGMPGGAKAGAGGLGAIIIAIVGLLFGVDLGGGGGTTTAPSPSGSGGGAFTVDSPSFGGNDQATADPDGFASCELDVDDCLTSLIFDTQLVWDQLFENAGRQYEPTTMVYYEGETQTNGCGIGRAAAGPFYCGHPNDQKVYIDLGAMEGLQRQLGAVGDFAQAYIIAHEVGHHIQAITGISDQVRSAQSQNPTVRNELSVRQELQADCFAGVWAFYANQRGGDEATGRFVLDPGDLEEAINAASAVGDDSIQSRQGYVDPHTFTHGSSAQRINWFKQGLASGSPDNCDTFSISNP